MKILLLGGGGREHALAWKIAQSEKCEKLFIAPGNAGTQNVGENVNIKADDFEALKNFAVENGVDMVVVGPEDPLVKGVYDDFKADPRTQNIPVIGPSKAGAVLEGSKDFAKQFIAVVKGKDVTVEGINAAMKAASNESFGYNEDLIVSSDIIGMRYGSLFDATQTMVSKIDDDTYQVQVVSWYDNENSYTSQMVRTIKYLAELK